jgi:hypothetical protein
MKYAVEIVSVAMIYTPCFIKRGSDIQELVGGGIHRRRQHGDHISVL